MAAVAVAVAGLAPLAATPARAQSLEEIDRRQAALLEAWERSPLLLRRTALVSEPPAGYGLYTERPSRTYRQGEAVIAYAEPVGYGWRTGEDGLHAIDIAVDFTLETGGAVVAGRREFLRVNPRSRSRVTELMLTLSLELTAPPPADYLVEYRLRDLTTGKTATFGMPFTVVP